MTTAEFHPLTPPSNSDYTISSSDGTTMDDVSLGSSRMNTNTSRHINNPLSSGASVSSKFSLSSRKAMKDSDLGSSLLDEGDENGNGTTATAAATTKSYLSEDDPFYMFRADLVQKLASVDEELQRYLSVVRTTDTAANAHRVKEAKKRLKRSVRRAESTISDLETTVRVVERGREKFPHIGDAEIAERRGFVDDSKGRATAAWGETQSDEVRRKLVGDDRALSERGRGEGGDAAAGSSNGANRPEYGRVGSDPEEGCAAAADPDRSETMLMMRRQDETLEDLDMAVTRVGYMAETIHEEIDTQNVMLKSLDEDLTDAEEQLGVVMGKLAKLLKTKSKFQIGLIVILILVVLILFFLVVYLP